MARLLQIFGWAFLLLGIMFLGLMGIMAISGPPLTDPAGSVWYKLGTSSLNQFQVLIQRILGLPDLWDGYIVPILGAPAWQPMSVIVALSLVIGVLLLAGARSRRRAGIIHRSSSS